MIQQKEANERLSDYMIDEILRRSSVCYDYLESKESLFECLKFLADPFFFKSVNKICAELLELREKKQ